MAYSGNFKYRGVDFDFHGETKQHMVDALAGIDYLLTRQEATSGSEADSPAAKAEAAVEKPADKAAAKSGKKGAKGKATTASEDGPNMTAEDAKAAEEKAAEEKAAEEKAAEEKAAEEKATEEKAAEEKATEEKTEPVSLDDLRSAVMAYAKAKGNVKGKALVEKYGAAKISDVPEDQWANLLAEAQAGV